MNASNVRTHVSRPPTRKPPANPEGPQPRAIELCEAGGRVLLTTGRPIGERSVLGKARYIGGLSDLGALQPGEILMTDATGPEWEPDMHKASAFIVNESGPDSHAAQVAEALGIPAVIGVVDGASPLWTGATVAVVCSGDGVGRVYECDWALRVTPA